MKTTLNKILKSNICKTRYEELLKKLGKIKADDSPIEILTIFNLNGLDDALWCLRAVDGYEKEMRLFAVWCARRAQKNIKDARSIAAINIAEKFANGQASRIELKNAWADGDASLDGGWPAEESAAKAAFTSAKWFAALADSSEIERNAQENEFRRILST